MLEHIGDRPAHIAIPKEMDDASNVIIGAAIEVHRHLGPGLLEAIYEKALVHELRLREVKVDQQVPVSFLYKGLKIEGQRLDLLVQDGVIVELKAIDKVLEVHEAKVLGYLRSTGLRLGLIINFNLPVVARGVKRIVN